MTSYSRDARPAYVEDADSDGDVYEGSAQVAASIAPGSPSKEKSNTHKSCRMPASPASSDDASSTGSFAENHRTHRTSMRDRDHPRSPQTKRVTYEDQPRHQRSTPYGPGLGGPPPPDDASYYGMRDPGYGPPPEDYGMVPGGSRPRARTNAEHRHSYHHVNTASRPPLANWKYQQHHTYHPAYPPQGPPPQMMAGSFPPAPPSFGPWGAAPMPPHMGPLPPMGYPPMQPPPPVNDYFPPPPPQSTRSLETRLGKMSLNNPRPQSSIGHRSSRHDDGYYEQENHQVSLPRRPSIKKPGREEDAMRMPPPPRRPKSTAPALMTGSFGAPPPRGQSHRIPDENPFPYAPPTPGPDDLDYDDSRAVARRPSVSSRRPRTMSYDHGAHGTEVARTGGGRSNRRTSAYYGQDGGAALNEKISAATDAKLNEAMKYQTAVEGPTLELTAETLREARKASKHTTGPSSRSTRSTESRDESDYLQQSNGTRTTRYTDEGDNMTVRINGNATLMFNGAEVKCPDGAEINFSSGRASLGGGGSDRASHYGGHEERWDRTAQRRLPSSRPRDSSQSGSYTRSRYDDRDIYEERERERERELLERRLQLPPLPPPPIEDRDRRYGGYGNSHY